jgi:Predicted acetyltransferases and hydrolases with the alpha/beta hydrolase fold
LSGEGASIHDLALAMLDQIVSREESAPHVLFVAHSLGGLIVKQVLRRCADSANIDHNAIGRSVAGVAFLGTPHQGSQFSMSLDVLLRQFKSKQSK